ncbi:MAG: hypothetical protein GY867_06645 [bacterium]|nr:hypothetical protein [bacterium]
MKANVELKGLCLTCNHTETCMYLVRSTGPIWHCEEHDDCNPISATTSTVVAPEPTTGVAQSPQSVATDQPLGLCRNCDKLPTCCLPKAEGGVWFCEEYE